MPIANVQDRASLERVYPIDAFASDAAENGQTTNQIIRGVCILSAPNDSGDFEFERASRHVGEPRTPNFLSPHRRDESLVNAGRDGSAPPSTRADPAQDYAEFLADIVGAAQRFGFEPEKSPGLDEPRLQGLRQ